MAEISPQIFWSRLRALHAMFKARRENAASGFQGVDALVVWIGKAAESGPELDAYKKATVLSIHLLDGYEFPDTLFYMTDKHIAFVCSEKKVRLIQACKKPKGDADEWTLDLITRGKQPEEWDAIAQTFANRIKANGKAKKVAVLFNQEEDGFGKLMYNTLQQTDLKLVDGERCLQEALLVKDSKAMESVKTAAIKAAKVADRWRKDLPSVDQEDATLTYEHFEEELKKAVADENEEMECSAAVIQSGASGYNMGVGVHTPLVKHLRLSFDTILVSVGARSHQYMAFVARTLIIAPTPYQEKAYNTLLAARDAAIAALKPGAALKEAYLAAQRVASEGGFSLGPDVGFGIGLHFMDSAHKLNATNELTVMPDATFCVDVYFHEVELPEADAVVSADATPELKGKFSMRLADTVFVKDSSAVENMTESAKDTWARVHFAVDDGDDVEEEAPVPEYTETRRKTRSMEKTDEQKREELRKKNLEIEMAQNQRLRMEKKAMLALRGTSSTGAGGEDNDDGTTPGAKKAKLPRAYRMARDLPLPQYMRRDRIFCDVENEAVLLPLNGMHVPFHISVIKSVNKVEEPGAGLLRFNFYFPAGTIPKEASPEMRYTLEKFPQAAYFKELSFRIRDASALNSHHRAIHELQKRVKARQKQEFEERGLVEQTELVILKDRKKEAPGTLEDISMLPSIARGATRCVGRLRAHVNGLRFSSEKQGEVDIIYQNIKYFFYQPPTKDVSKVLIHFYLRNPILVGKKKTRHVQFFTDVIKGSNELNARGDSNRDHDELDEDEREKQLRKKLDRAFQRFYGDTLNIARANGQTIGDDNEVEKLNNPKLGFFGKPFKEMAFIQPTAHCLVNLVESEHLVVPVDEIEHIHFERVVMGKSKTFDMVIILKAQMALDGSAEHIKVQKIEIIDQKFLDVIRFWIDSQPDLTYTFGPSSLNWEEVMKAVHSELEAGVFWQDHDTDGEKKDVGWNFLNVYGDDDDEEDGDDDEDEDDEEFSGSEESGSEEDDDGSDDWGSVVEDEEDDSEEDGDAELSESGMDSDELEQMAEEEDRKARRREEERDDRPSKKAKRG